MKTLHKIVLILFLLLIHSCIVQFIPETDEDKELLVVEGIITDQPGPNTIKLSKSMPLGKKNVAKPVKGCIVTISDDLGNYYSLTEKPFGTYTTNPAVFTGAVGRTYTLHINTNTAYNNQTYESLPMELKPVPPIDSIYYEKKIIEDREGLWQPVDGCQIYLNTHDPNNYCKYYRWEYDETWEFRLPYSAPENRICWLSGNSEKINIKNTSVLGEDRINRYPLCFITNATDRLKVRYSMLVNQYSLNEDEFLYWEKLQNLSEEVGGLYDITPSAIPSNIWCVEDPNEKVLGYFSVSAISSKRLFIKDYFNGIIDLYSECISDTIYGRAPIPGLNESVWLLEDYLDAEPPYRVITWKKDCADCTIRGTNIEPLFWKEGKKQMILEDN